RAPKARGEVDGLGLDLEGGGLVIRREIAAEGRSRAWVNGSPTTAGVLAELGALLVDLHGQHDSPHVVRADIQRDLLDAFGEAMPERAALAALVDELHAAEAGERE